MQDILCERMRHIGNENSVELTKLIMNSLHNRLKDCDSTTYTQIFVRAAALGMQIDKAMKDNPLPGERWAEFISNKLDLGIN